MTTRCSDSEIVEMWVERQPSPHTRSCYRRDCERLLAHTRKPLLRITLGDLQSFAQSLAADALATIWRARTVAATRSLFAFCHRMRYLPANPAQELPLPASENRLAERIVAEEDVQRMIAGVPKVRDRVLLSLLYGAGLRVFRGLSAALAQHCREGRNRANHGSWQE